MKYYLQDSRQYVGNCMLFWGLGNNGYTTNLLEAQRYTEEEAFKHHKNRETDIPWPVNYIQSRIRPTVDMQKCNHREAMEGKP